MMHLATWRGIRLDETNRIAPQQFQGLTPESALPIILECHETEAIPLPRIGMVMWCDKHRNTHHINHAALWMLEETGADIPHVIYGPVIIMHYHRGVTHSLTPDLDDRLHQLILSAAA